MRRASLVMAVVAILASMFPAAVNAGRVAKFVDHRVTAFCEGDVEGGFVSSVVESSEAFGPFAAADVWLGEAIPFEDPATWSGLSNTVDVSEGDPVELNAALDFFDPDHNPTGTGSIAATLTRVGDPIIETPDPFFSLSNLVSHTERTIQNLEGSATLTLPDDSVLDVGCFGEIVDESVFETSPHAVTFANEGVFVDCFWETEDGGAFLHIEDNEFGFFGDAGLFTAGLDLLTVGSSGSISVEGADASIDLVDNLTGDPYTAAATAAFTPVGGPVTSFLVSEDGQQKQVEQRLSPDGSVEFSTGDTFPIDNDHCFAATFDVHNSFNAASGPKPGPAPSNDAPEGAIELTVGSRVQVNTTGTVNEPEMPITTCDQGVFDDLGHTVWYTLEGTGGDVTIDTAGTRFDTVLAVYVMEGDELVEIACVDDVFVDPIGTTFQAAISGPTQEGVTYWIQVGGFKNPEIFGGGEAQSGRLKVEVRAGS
jgi:hypothetical protein